MGLTMRRKGTNDLRLRKGWSLNLLINNHRLETIHLFFMFYIIGYMLIVKAPSLDYLIYASLFVIQICVHL